MTRNVLFLCTGNSARSIMAEAYLNHISDKNWQAYSAGSHPNGEVNPFALETLKNAGIKTDTPESKSWDVFLNSPVMDTVITVCDNAAGETCPIWPGDPVKHHWSFADPAAIEGDDQTKLAAFEFIFAGIRFEVDAFLNCQTPSQKMAGQHK